MGLGPIPASKIRLYAEDELDLYDDEGEAFFEVIRRMDGEYLTLKNGNATPADKVPRDVAIDDVAGTRKLFRNLSAKQKRWRKKPDKS